MDTTTLIWIIVAVVVVLAIVAVAFFVTAKGRTERRETAQHDKAEKLRESARESELSAREHEAQVAQARADAASATAAAEQAKARAAQASIDADRHAGTIEEHEANAAKYRTDQADTLRKADDIDPYVADTAAAGTATTRDADDRVDATVRDDAHGEPRMADDTRTTADGRVATDDPRTDADESRAADEPVYRAPATDADGDGVPDRDEGELRRDRTDRA